MCPLRDTSGTAVVVDTNVFVAAGFNQTSASAHILEQVRSGRLRMIWNDATRRETRHVLHQIPPLSWSNFAELFREQDRYHGTTHPEELTHIPDPDDRKFAALSQAAGAVLLTNDDHLLAKREQVRLEVLTPREFWDRSRDEQVGSDSA